MPAADPHRGDTLNGSLIRILVTLGHARNTAIPVASSRTGFRALSSITIQDTNRNPNSKTLITIDHPRWVINTDTQSHMVSIHISPSNHSTRHKCQPPLNKPLIFVNCATVKAITITNANLQVILWHAHKKPLIKADHTVTKTLIMGNGHKVTVTTMTQMGNLFSSGGSRCR